MPIELTWFIPNRILLMSWSGQVTADDICIMIDELSVVYNHVDGYLHAIIELYEVEHVDPHVVQVFIHHPAFSDPHRGQVALVRLPHQFLPIVIEANKIAQEQFVHIFETRIAAQNFLLTLDAERDD